MDLLNPPPSYIRFRCFLHGVPGDEVEARTRTFYKQNAGTRDEIRQFSNWLHRARNERSLPCEKVEIRELDGKKHGRVVPMMLFDIEYWEQEGRIHSRKIYMADQGELLLYRTERSKEAAPVSDSTATRMKGPFRSVENVKGELIQRMTVEGESNQRGFNWEERRKRLQDQANEIV
jgi:hypothetical protein